MRVYATDKSINLPFIQGTAKRYKIVMPNKAFIGILAEVEPDGDMFKAKGISLLQYQFGKYIIKGSEVKYMGKMSVGRSMDYVYINSNQPFTNSILIDEDTHKIYTLTESYPWNNDEARWLYKANQRKQYEGKLDINEEENAVRVRILDSSLTTDDAEYIVRKCIDRNKTIVFEYGED